MIFKFSFKPCGFNPVSFFFIFSGNCLLVKNQDHGTLTSPDYPKAYFGNEHCRLEIWTTPGQRLQVKFKV